MIDPSQSAQHLRSARSEVPRPQVSASRALPAHGRPGQAEERGALTLIVPIQPGHRGQLEALLSDIASGIKKQPTDAPLIDFHQLSTVHFLRWVLLPEERLDGQRALLAFESNHDGSRQEHLKELLRVGGSTLRSIYRHCEGYEPEFEGDEQAFISFLLRHAQRPAAFFRAYPRLSAQSIRENAWLSAVLRSFLSSPEGAALRGKAPERIHEALRRHALGEPPRLYPLPAPPPAPRWQERAARLLMESRPAQALLLVGMLPVLLPLAIRLRLAEWRDAAEPKTRDAVAPEVANQEDFIIQNQLTHLVEVKAGRFRLHLLRRVLRAIDSLATWYYTQGKLGQITTVHFARWLILEGTNGRHWLLFFSNYDGSWESYLGEFIDRASVGLSSIWSNTQGFPKTRWLVLGGSRHEEAFKQWTRDHQLLTHVWFSAHPDKSIHDILRDDRLRAGLLQWPDTPGQLEAWLSLL